MWVKSVVKYNNCKIHISTIFFETFVDGDSRERKGILGQTEVR